jgi:hypothetical protein
LFKTVPGKRVSFEQDAEPKAAARLTGRRLKAKASRGFFIFDGVFRKLINRG